MWEFAKECVTIKDMCVCPSSCQAAALHPPRIPGNYLLQQSPIIAAGAVRGEAGGRWGYFSVGGGAGLRFPSFNNRKIKCDKSAVTWFHGGDEASFRSVVTLVDTSYGSCHCCSTKMELLQCEAIGLFTSPSGGT